MSWFVYALTAIHLVVCIFLIIVVLLQSGKSADLAGAFGGGGSQSTFGPRGAASALSRATTAGVIIFMLTSISLSILASRGSNAHGSVLQGTTQSKPAPAQTPVPAPAPTK
jgi:preprotein translocase subunit SecG